MDRQSIMLLNKAAFSYFSMGLSHYSLEHVAKIIPTDTCLYSYAENQLRQIGKFVQDYRYSHEFKELKYQRFKSDITSVIQWLNDKNIKLLYNLMEYYYYKDGDR